MSHESDQCFTIEFINGTEMSKVYFEGLLQDRVLKDLLDTTHCMHEQSIDDGCAFTEEEIRSHYIAKFEERSLASDDYPFSDFATVYRTVRSQLDEFLALKLPLNAVVHGDLWFSNIMIYKRHFKFLDMRGKFANRLSVKGHRFYDWAKILQSLIGLDAIIDHGITIDSEIKQSAVALFWEHLVGQRYIDPEHKTIITRLTGYLIYNTFHAYPPTFSLKQRGLVWELVKECVME